MKKYFFIIELAAIVASLLFFGALACARVDAAHAAGLSVTPAVIDDHGLPRDMMNYTVTVKNTDNHVVIVFASVHNLTADGKQQFIDTADADKSTSLANWMSISRGSMTFQPGETKTMPLGIQINPYATAGTYHAVVAFVEGSTRDEAEAHLDGAPQVLVNLDVQSNAKEDLQLLDFSAAKRFSSSFPAAFTYTIENDGNVTSTPAGLVIFYDHLGHEIGSVNANPENVAIAPGEKHSFGAEWGSGTGFGQYKAMLDLTYGANGEKLQDVALVWVLPWEKLLGIFAMTLVFMVILAVLVHGKYAKRHHRRTAFIRTLIERHNELLTLHTQAPAKTDHVLDLRHPDSAESSKPSRQPAPPPPPPPKSKKNIFKKLFLIVAVVGIAAFSSAPHVSRADDAIALTITPPFFELNVNPGDAWASSIKVVNANGAPLPVYASVEGFAPSDEQGRGKFIDLSSLANDRDALANWITAPQGPIAVSPDGASDVPFSIVVPKDASPGGHYAAILIGTGPVAGGTPGSHIGVSSYISALIFVRVGGEVNEQGSIAEFSTPQATYQQPDVQFKLRFQNSGNVHLRPVGEIQIYNAWGKERGKIDVNQTGDLGYVLPSSTREFDFEWKGQPNIFDIGPYTAIATLAYGENGSKSVSQTISFWILPIWNLLEVIGGTLFFLAVFVIAIRRYIRRALAKEMGRIGKVPEAARPPQPPQPEKMRGGIAEGTIDLRNAHLHERAARKWTLRRVRRIVFYICLALGLLWIAFSVNGTIGGGRPFQFRTSEPGQPSQWTQGASGN